MDKRILFLLALILIAPVHACFTDSECPTPTCLGASRVCDLGTCKQTQCLASFSEKNVQANAATVGEYQEEIPLQERAIEAFFTIFGRWPILILFALYIYALYKLYAYLGPRPKFLILFFFSLFFLYASVTTLFSFTGEDKVERIWGKMSIEDFHKASKTDLFIQLDGNQLSNLADGLHSGGRWFIQENGEEIALTILKFENRSAVRNFQFNQLGFSKVKKIGEVVYQAQDGGRDTYIFDEDRFVFILSGDQGSLGRELNTIINNYPYRVDRFRSRLALLGSQGPTFFDFEPKDGSATREDTIRFTIADDIEVLGESITSDAPLFSSNDCKETQDGYICAFTTILQEGENTFTFSAEDNAGNVGKKTITIYKDLTPPTISFLQPTQGDIINDTTVLFSIEDDFAVDLLQTQVIGLKGFSFGTKNCQAISKGSTTCTFISEPNEGINTMTVLARDEALNTIEQSLTYTYENAPRIKVQTPREGSYTNNPLVTFTVGDVTGIDHKSVIVSTSSDFEEVFPLCIPFGKGFEINYRCQKQLPKVEGFTSVTITAVDETERISKKLHSFYVDLRPPQFSIQDPVVRRRSVMINFTVTDPDAGIDVDSLQFKGINTIDIVLDCGKEAITTQSFEELSCLIYFDNVPKGSHVLTFESYDRAGNTAKASISVTV